MIEEEDPFPLGCEPPLEGCLVVAALVLLTLIALVAIPLFDR
jgi:hypothetical protein